VTPVLLSAAVVAAELVVDALLGGIAVGSAEGLSVGPGSTQLASLPRRTCPGRHAHTNPPPLRLVHSVVLGSQLCAPIVQSCLVGVADGVAVGASIGAEDVAVEGADDKVQFTLVTRTCPGRHMHSNAPPPSTAQYVVRESQLWVPPVQWCSVGVSVGAAVGAAVG